MGIEKNQEVRRAVLEYLGARPKIAQSLKTIWQKLRHENPDFSEREIAESLEFLIGLNYVKKNFDELGGVSYYQATSSGVLYIERSYGL